MKTLTFFAILLIASSVTTKKKVTFEDLVTSFSQLDDPKNDALGKLQQVGESFTEANKLLLATETTITGYCERMAKTTNATLAKGLKQIADLGDNNKELNEQIETAKKDLAENGKNMQEEHKKIKTASGEVESAAKEQQKKESDIVETIKILRRLRNLAEDELVGQQRNATVGNYNIVNKYNVSFIQMQTASNMKEDLKTLMHKTETPGKNLISSLILMLTTDDGNFANQGRVKKILEVLDRLIKKNQQRKLEVQGEFDQLIKTQKEIIENSLKSIEQINAASTKLQTNLDVLRRTINMNNREVQYLTQMKQRKEGKLKFDRDICDKHIAVVAAHKKRYTTTQAKINELKQALV